MAELGAPICLNAKKDPHRPAVISNLAEKAGFFVALQKTMRERMDGGSE